MPWWLTEEGRPWNADHQIRVARRFRAHVRTKKKPNAPIVRDQCSFCARSKKIEAHHVDYDKPFLIVWVCREHHRLVERGKLKIETHMLRNYAPFVRTVPSRWIDTPF